MLNKFLIFLNCFNFLVFLVNCNQYHYQNVSRNDLNLFITEEREVSYNRILRQFDKTNFDIFSNSNPLQPNYYHVVRQNSITILSLIDILKDSDFSPNYRELIIVIEQFIDNFYQEKTNQSNEKDYEEIYDGKSKNSRLKNFKYCLDKKNPLTDSIALKSISIIKYLNLLKKYNNGLIINDNLAHMPSNTTVSDIYFTVVKPDLQYILDKWEDLSYGLWDNVKGFHLFTSLIQLKSLVIGGEFSRGLNFEKDFTISLFSNADCLKEFIVHESGYIQTNSTYLIESPLQSEKHRNPTDSSIIIASLLSHDYEGYENNIGININDKDNENENENNLSENSYIDNLIPFNATDHLLLNTAFRLVDDFKSLYKINDILHSGIAIGRDTKERVFNPAFISTSYFSEVFYKYIFITLKHKQDIKICKNYKSLFEKYITKNYFQIDGNDIKNLDQNGDYIIKYGSKNFEVTIEGLLNFSDSFLKVIQKYVDYDGSMSETFNGVNGKLEGMKNLTWNYASFLSSTRWRLKVIKLIKKYNEEESRIS
ncbi:glycoside hydrolase family 15 protein [Ascoidea rubescens DSM 1968]|uniref:glucan 1,4-alpha-glucosidase n=1 Tax=Ascoidea rubescens DSM 1968 TaxID=1344418 RepID=A0A1D2V9S3_9ASCO|nr:glycoside hydrolase family 15 protein [Ascoidea rubescens DSM 1968]ODV58384.1 glycoside hydrolase family 15 protein [Ascoidea rubescens DSM 1968]